MIALKPNTVAFTATVEFQDDKGNGFEWVGIECDTPDLQTALLRARNKALGTAYDSEDMELFERLGTAAAALIKINCEWDSSGKMI